LRFRETARHTTSFSFARISRRSRDPRRPSGRRVEQDKKHIQELEEPSEIVEFTVGGKIVSEFSIDNNPDAPFGIAIGNFNHASEFAYLNDNKNTLTVRRLADGGSSD
jgi:hypothetical protein